MQTGCLAIDGMHRHPPTLPPEFSGASIFGADSLSLEWRSLATAVTGGGVDAHVLVVVETSACQGLIWQ